MKKIMTCVAVAAMTAMAHAQTTNRALTNADGTGMAEAFTLTELDGADEATFQMWVNPTAWTQATLIGQDNFSIEMMGATEGQIAVKAGDGTATFTVDGMVGKWTQLTVTVAGGTVKAYADNTEVAVTGGLPAQFEATATEGTKGCVIAKGLKGRMDEIRVWTGALAQEDFFWQNTLNKWNDNYDILAAYWKCDQQLEGALLDYRNMNEAGHHNASLTGITKDAVTDNAAFRYRVVSGYVPSIMRFTDRPNMNRDMFLLTNDVITLSAKVQSDGSLRPEYPDNSAEPTNVDYLADWKGRTGIMSFNGNGSQMVSDNALAPFNPTGGNGYGDAGTASITSWIYIDEWVEGAELFSNYKDADHCIVVKLGREADKEIVVDVCGTVGTLKGKLETGKWQFVGTYISMTKGSISDPLFFINPIYIGVGEYDANGEFQSTIYNAENEVVLSGKDMDLNTYPLNTTGTITIGKNFTGKMDEIKVWGSSRRGAIGSDATKEYEWGSGVWDDLFLNAYWKGDDPENIGKDSQCLSNVASIWRGYYNNYSGAKVRLGIIADNNAINWKNVLSNESNLNNLIRDAKELVKDFDGLDVDLEWSYSESDWNIYNNVARRLINEVMAEYPEKIFSCSLHQVSYSGFDKALLPDVDYFTFQQYGPNIFPTFDDYKNFGDKWLEWGFGKEKIEMSYATLTMTGSSEEGYKDLFEKYGMTDDNFDPDVNQWTVGSTTYHFSGLNQVKQKAQYVVDNDLHGIMFFDMANDLKVSDYKSLIRAQNEVISANVDTVMTVINMTPSGVRPIAARTGEELFTAVQDGDNINVTLADAATPATLAVYSVDGRAMMQMPLQGKQTAVPADGLGRGIYLLRVTQGSESHSVKIAIR